MPLYPFHLFGSAGAPFIFDAVELSNDAATVAHAGEMLSEHLSSDHIEVWDGERGVVARYREQSIIRPVPETAAAGV